MKIRLITLMIAGLFSGLFAGAEPSATAFELTDVTGTIHTLSQYTGKIVVLEWTNYDCPFVKKFYKPGVMQAMQKTYTDQDVIWLSICSSAPGKQGNLSVDEWARRIKETGAKATAVLLDPDGTVGRAYGASNTPHLFVIGPDGQVAYQGSVDDKRSANPKDIAGARNYLVEALDALLAGDAVPVSKVKAYGCSVKY